MLFKEDEAARAEARAYVRTPGGIAGPTTSWRCKVRMPDVSLSTCS